MAAAGPSSGSCKSESSNDMLRVPTISGGGFKTRLQLGVAAGHRPGGSLAMASSTPATQLLSPADCAAAFRACDRFKSRVPGRCPGLACCGPFGARLHAARVLRDEPILNRTVCWSWELVHDSVRSDP